MRLTPLPPLGLAVATSLLCGVVAVQALPSLPPLLPVLALLGLALMAGWRSGARSGYLRLLAAFVLGVAMASGHAQWVLAQQWPEKLSGHDVWITGKVQGLVASDADSARFAFAIETGEGDAAPLQGHVVRLAWYQGHAEIQPGARWRFLARLRPPSGVLNPGGFDFERRALEQRIAATGTVRSHTGIAKLTEGGGIDWIRERMSREIAHTLRDRRARFVQALALGDTRGLDDRDWEILRATGLTHLIAISGFHVGMVAGLAALLAGLFYRAVPTLGNYWPRPQAMALVGLAAATGYAALAGFSLPTVRTLLMIASVLLARLLRRPQRLLDAFALALIVVLLVDPLSVLSAGFWLSFAGVAWLMWCLPHDRDRGLVAGFLRAQGVAMLGLLPLTVWFFSQASLSAPLVNLLAIPWISLAVAPLAVLGLLIRPLSVLASDGLWQLSAWLMDTLWLLLQRIADWPPSLLWLPEPSVVALGLAVLGVFWLLLPRGVPGKPAALLLLLPLLLPNLNRPLDGQAQVMVLDVGQGLSVLVLTRNHALLFDAGPAPARGLDFGEAAVLPGLRALGVSQVDRLLLSHGDNDHAGGAAAVMRAFPTAHVSAPEGWARAGMTECQRGQHWHWDGVTFRILHPPPLYPYQRNNSSCVLRIDVAGASALLPGDISQVVEARLLKEQAPALRADLLIAPHHGSAGSSSAYWVAAVQPKHVVFAVGRDNRFHLPREEAVARYRELGATLHDSAGSGAIRFQLDTGGVHVLERLRFDRRRYWRHARAMHSGYAIDSSQ